MNMATMVSLGFGTQQSYKSIPDKEFAIKHIESLQEFAIIAKGNIIEGIKAEW